MLLMGDDGLIQLDLGDGLQCSAEITSYRLQLERSKLETTAQGDEFQTYVAGIKGWSGDISFNIRLVQNALTFTAAQLIPSILADETEAEIDARFYLQRRDGGAECGEIGGITLGQAWIGGTIILDQITIDITGAGDLIQGACNFTGTGEPVFRYS